MKTVLFTALVAFVLVTATPAEVLAQSPQGTDQMAAKKGGKKHSMAMGRGLERALEEVELPEDLRAQIDDLLDDSRQETRDLRRQARTERKAMRELLQQDVPDENAIMAAADRMGAIGTEMKKIRLRSLIRVRALLSPDQREELTQVMESRRWRKYKKYQ